ncbi:hypothetical protein BDFB_012920 [Asbolus verrucosus]|uniref:Transposase Tc1-like domain-containing protein n=1 Tax=Asbolus verrucosus TaxID=1661398 RepID=A0A482VFI9_ASBVE|nr:hypothetical protein BDFB_012920 [Asbolus verrucosus]
MAAAKGISLKSWECTISRALARFNETGEYTRRPSQGPHRVTTRGDNRFLQLIALGLHAQVPATGPILIREHRVGRLKFAREHVHWQNNDRRRVLFFDESRFCLWSSDRRVLVYRRLGERFS